MSSQTEKQRELKLLSSSMTCAATESVQGKEKKSR